MTILAYKHDDAISLIKSFDVSHQVQDDQIVDIVLDLDSWDQEADGVIELQGSGYDTKAKLSEIIHQRTGLIYNQAPKFYDKIEQAFLDRRIPLLPGEAAASLEGGMGATATSAVAGSIAVSAAVPVSAQALENVLGNKDYLALGRLIDEVKAAEKYWSAQAPLPSFHRELPSFNRPLPRFGGPEFAAIKLKQCQELREVLTALRAEVGTAKDLLKQMGEGSEAHLGHRGLADAMKVTAYRKEMLRELVNYYRTSNDVRQSDINSLRVYLDAAKKTNLHLSQVSRTMNAAAAAARSMTAVAPQSQTALQSLRAAGSRLSDALSLAKAARGVSSLANGVRTFLAPARAWVNQSSGARAVAPVAAALAVGGLIFLAVDSAADAGPKAPKETELVKPEKKTEILKTDSKPTPGPGPDGTWKFEDLPQETFQITDLPNASPTAVKPRRTAAKK